jgi:hypothetical protein
MTGRSDPVSEVVLKVVALVLQNVEGLVLDLPPGPATGAKFDDGIGTDRQIGDEAVAVGGLAASVDDLDLEPVDDQRIAPVAQRDNMEPAIAVYEALLATLDRLLQHRQIGAVMLISGVSGTAGNRSRRRESFGRPYGR